MARELTLRLITPEHIPVDTTVSAVTVPALDGEIGILPRHAPLIAALDTGIVRYTAGASEHEVFVDGGFAQVRGDTVRVLSPVGEPKAEIDLERAREAERRARERLAVRGAAVDVPRAEGALRRALLRQRLKGER